MLESTEFPKYVVIKCATLDQLTAAMSSIDAALPIEHIRVTSDLEDLLKDRDFRKGEAEFSKEDDDMGNGDTNSSNYDECPLEIAEESNLLKDQPNKSAAQVKEEPLDEEESVMEHETPTTLSEAVFRENFIHDHCYTNRVKAESEVDDNEPIIVEDNGPSIESTSYHKQENEYHRLTSADYLNGQIPLDHMQFRRKYQRKKDPNQIGKKKTLYGDVSCNLCHTKIAVKGKDWHAKSAHAIIHTNIERYHCPICELYGSRHRAEVARHIERVHEVKTTGITIQEDMSPDDILELRNMVSVCFGTSMNKRGKLQTQLLNFYEEQLAHE